MKSPTLESSDGVLRDIGADRAVVTHHDAARRAAEKACSGYCSSINTSKLARRRKVAQDENLEARIPKFETISNDQNTRNNINSVSIAWV